MRREGGVRANEYVPPTRSQADEISMLHRSDEEKYTLGSDVKDDGSREVKLHRKNKKVLVKTKRKLEGDHTESDPEIEMRAALAELGYPKKEVARLMADMPAAEKIVSTNLSYSNPKISQKTRDYIEKVVPLEPITEHADIIKKIGAWLPGAMAKAAYNKIKKERNMGVSQIRKIAKNWLPDGKFKNPTKETVKDLVFDLVVGDTLIHPQTKERYKIEAIPDYVALPRDPRQEEINYFFIKNPDGSTVVMDTDQAEAWIIENALTVSEKVPKERGEYNSGKLWWEDQEDTQPRISRYEVPKEAASISSRFREEDAIEQKLKDERYVDTALRKILPKLNKNEIVLIKGGQIIIERKIIDTEGIKPSKTQYLPYEQIAEELDARATHKRAARHAETVHSTPVEKGLRYWEMELQKAKDPLLDPKGEGAPDQKFIAFIERKIEKLRAQEIKEEDEFEGEEDGKSVRYRIKKFLGKDMGAEIINEAGMVIGKKRLNKAQFETDYRDAKYIRRQKIEGDPIEKSEVAIDIQSPDKPTPVAADVLNTTPTTKEYGLMTREQLVEEFRLLKNAVNSSDEEIKANAQLEFKKVQSLLIKMRGK